MLEKENIKLQTINEELNAKLSNLNFANGEDPKLVESSKLLMANNKATIDELARVKEELNKVKESRMNFAKDNWQLRQELLKLKPNLLTPGTKEMIRQKSLNDQFLLNLIDEQFDKK